MSGRRPKPTQIKILEGNPGKRKIEADDLQPEAGIPEMPKGMTFAAQREWKFMCEALIELGVLTRVDGKALAAYCECYARWEEANKLITEYGQVIQVKFQDNEGNVIIGDLKANPACKLSDMWLNRMKSYLIEFGLTPATRSKLKLTPKPEVDEFDEIMNRTRRSPVGFQIPQAEERPSVELVNQEEKENKS
jgi:P27 family predicted phage terminase small subunit